MTRRLAVTVSVALALAASQAQALPPSPADPIAGLPQSTSDLRAPGLQGGGFVRLRYGERQAPVVSYGLGLRQGGRALTERGTGVELRFDAGGPAVWRTGSQEHLVARLGPAGARLSALETPRRESLSGALVIGAVVLGVVVVAVALRGSDSGENCPDNTIPNPISGACEPLRL